MKLIKGGSIGDIYGKAFVRDDAGNIVYETEGDNKGLPLVEGEWEYGESRQCQPCLYDGMGPYILLQRLHPLFSA